MKLGYFGRQKLTLRESLKADKIKRMKEQRLTDKQKLEKGNQIRIVNKHLNNYQLVLEVQDNKPNEGILKVKDGMGSTEAYFYEDFEIYEV